MNKVFSVRFYKVCTTNFNHFGVSEEILALPMTKRETSKALLLLIFETVFYFYLLSFVF